MLKKQIKDETRFNSKDKAWNEKETDSFIEDFKELNKKAEDFTHRHFKKQIR